MRTSHGFLLILLLGLTVRAHAEEVRWEGIRSESSTGLLTAIDEKDTVIMVSFDGKWSNPLVGGLTFFETPKASSLKRQKLRASRDLIGSRVTIRISAPAVDWWMIRGGILGFPLADADIEIKSAFVVNRFNAASP